MRILRHTLLLLLCLAVDPAWAHKLAPSLLSLRQLEPLLFEVSWKTPRYTPTPVPILPELPPGCEELGERRAGYEGTGVRIDWRVRCEEPLEGRVIAVQGLAENQSATLVRIDWLDGTTSQGLLNGAGPAFTVPERHGRARISWDYARLGVEHILGGIDHLLFVLGLLLLVPDLRRLVWTITAFTAGHSVTLALATLGFLRYPVDFVEFLIAASIFVIAVELARGADERHWLRRRPWAAAGLFGLLHGMGFAGALREVGLPAHEIPLALLTFNLGIELGQLLFVAVVLAFIALWRRSPLVARPALAWVPVYLIGVLSAYWCIERGLATLAAL